MYHNHHDDHRYSNSDDNNRYNGRLHGTSIAGVSEGYDQAAHYRDDRHPGERYTEERQCDERDSEARYIEEHLYDEHHVDSDEIVLIAEPIDEEFYHEESYDEALYTEPYNGTHRDPEIYEFSQNGASVLYKEDFRDTQRGARNPFAATMGKIGIGLAIGLFTIGFAALTMFASKPQLTPEEIVQMEGYKGPTRDRTLFFNLASLRGCDDINDCDGVIRASTANEPSSPGSSNETRYGLRSADGDTSDSTDSSNYREIPAVATPASQIHTADSKKSSQWKVKQQWSNVRETPEMSGAIVTSLEADSRVTVVSKVGEWYEIATDNTSSEPLGFIHSSLLQPL